MKIKSVLHQQTVEEPCGLRYTYDCWGLTMPKVFRIAFMSVLAGCVAGAVFVSDARASDCTSVDCLSGVTETLLSLRAQSRLAGGTLEPVVEAATLDDRFVSRMSYLLNQRDVSTATSTSMLSGTRFRTANSFVEEDTNVLSLTSATTRSSRLFGRLDRNRFEPQIYIRTPTQSVYSTDIVATGVTQVASIPLPATLPLILAGIGSLAVVRRRRKSV